MRPKESFVGQPIRSLQTMLRVLAEDDASLPSLVPDGIYGQETTNAILAFQRKYGLPTTGVTDQTTWDRIVPAYEEAYIRVHKAAPIEIIMDPGKVFRLGESSPYIYLLQSLLTQLSNDHPAINRPDHSGVLDESTAKALTAFQLLSDLPQTGELDKITWKQLVHQFSLNAHHHEAQRRETE